MVWGSTIVPVFNVNLPLGGKVAHSEAREYFIFEKELG